MSDAIVTPLDPDETDRLHATRLVLPPCPFCGRHPITTGKQNKATGNFIYRVVCVGQPECGASVVCCRKDRESARAGAVAKWSRRAK